MDNVLEDFCQSIETGLDIAGVVGFDFTIIMTLLPMLLQLFAGCKQPSPPNPIPNPSATEQKAWELKSMALSSYDDANESYSRPVLHRMANHIKHKKKKDNEPISRQDALELSRSTLDALRTKPTEEIAAGLEVLSA